MPFHIGPTELVIVLVIVMIIFGVGKLPQVGGAVGKGLREFRKAQKDDTDEVIPEQIDTSSKSNVSDQSDDNKKSKSKKSQDD